MQDDDLGLVPEPEQSKPSPGEALISPDLTNNHPDTDLGIVPESENGPDNDLGLIPEKSEDSIGGQAIAGLEGAAQGLAGPLATYAETKLGVDPKGIKEREEKYPLTHGAAQTGALVASMFVPGLGEYTMLGNVGKAAKVAEAAAQAAKWGKSGQAFVGGLINAGAFAAGDKLTQAMLTDDHPEEPVSSALTVGAHALLGGALGAAFSTASPLLSKSTQKLEEIAGGNIKANIRSVVAGAGAASDGFKAEDIGKFRNANKYLEDTINEKYFNLGMDLHNDLLGGGVRKATKYLGALLGGVPGLVIGEAAGPTVEKIIGKTANKVVTPMILKIAASGPVTGGVGGAIRFADIVSRGAKSVDKNIENLFTSSVPAIVHSVSEKDRDALRDIIDNSNPFSQTNQEPVMTQNQQAPEGFADGGLAEPQTQGLDPQQQNTSVMATQYPAQTMMVQMAKGRVYNYLNSIKPRDSMQRLPFEKAIPDKQAQRKYDQVLDMANQPLSIFKNIRDGSLTKDHMQHFTSMYPELHDHLSKKMTERIVKAQLGGEKPSYKVRQMMSLFLNAPMDKSMTAQTVQSVQAMYAQSKGQPQQQGSPVKNKKGTSSLSKLPSNYKTAGQALEARQQKDS